MNDESHTVNSPPSGSLFPKEWHPLYLSGYGLEVMRHIRLNNIRPKEELDLLDSEEPEPT